jgi:dolichol-phosphate mannosyltransferase
MTSIAGNSESATADGSSAGEPSTSTDAEVTSGAGVLIMTCTYNEVDNLRELLPELFAVAPLAHVLVVDDGSPDGTGRLADELAERDPRVHVLHRSGKQGLGTAIALGLRYAVDNGYRFALNLDCDFSHHPRHLRAMLAAASNADVVIGSRYVPGGATPTWGWQRRAMSWCINTYARWMLGLNERDTSGGYRCYRTATVSQLDWSRFRAWGYAFQEEILYRCRRLGARTTETPIVFDDRRHGKSKINWREAVHAVWVIAVLATDRLRGVPVR